MTFGFIGAGTVAQTLSRHLLAFGHQVVLSNSRGVDSLKEVVAELGPGATGGTPQQAVDQDLVVLSVRWSQVPEALSAVPNWSGKVLVDATNRVESYEPLRLGDISGRTSSEIVADHAPGASVIKAFNTVPMAWIADVAPSEPRTVLFLSGDDALAKATLAQVLEQVGFAAIDLGSLATGGRLQQLGGALAGVRLSLTQRLAL